MNYLYGWRSLSFREKKTFADSEGVSINHAKLIYDFRFNWLSNWLKNYAYPNEFHYVCQIDETWVVEGYIDAENDVYDLEVELSSDTFRSSGNL